MDVSTKLEQITEVPFSLGNINDEHKDRLFTSIRENGFGYSREVLTVSLRSDIGSSYTSLDNNMSTLKYSNILNPAVQVALVHGHHRFIPLKKFLAGNEHLQSKHAGLKTPLITPKAGKFMTPH